MNNLIIGFALLAICAAVESAIITIEFPDENVSTRRLDETLQLYANHSSIRIRTPQSSRLVQHSGPVKILNHGESSLRSSQGAQNRDELLVKGSKKLENWLHSSNLDHSTTIHLFNVTNTERLYGDSVQLVGPFKFRQERTYTVDHFTDDEQFVVVKQSKKYQLIDNTNRLLERPITILNAPLIVSASRCFISVSLIESQNLNRLSPPRARPCTSRFCVSTRMENLLEHLRRI